MAILATERSDVFSLLDVQAQNAGSAARIFHASTAEIGQVSAHLQELEALKARGDALKVREDVLHRNAACEATSEVTLSLEAEYLLSLSRLLDETTGSIQSAMNRIALSGLSKSRFELESMAGLLVAMTCEVRELVALFLQNDSCREALDCVSAGLEALEMQAHRMYERATVALCTDPSLDDRLRGQWQAVFEYADQAAGQCGRVAASMTKLMALRTSDRSPEPRQALHSDRAK